ncbi:MAG: transporter substrate-binding domain-containing protein [Alphaproteobacteria bacterium]|nr:transporter substrate-binding domain-containing protein [Alphaproteobacteria bacterium]MBT4019025.1 transporter substrate-binding domain-containing protein [Alphaproteobacteria bacterium]MBT4965650.1 transporter substrate-binding domain-containing protein [Alphaproteobacteria bacterium]MBT5159519.1 transporter substrate-binding domain-containing protein [Alphaproteobacteria bacterium]MBT5917371.1 transporter substrate-binding domain-containing protein [Alphaproteobacteria bacterium]
MRTLLAALALYCLLTPASLVQAASDEKITLIGSVMPPFVVKKGGKITGFIPDLLQEAMRRAKVKHVVKVQPWAQAYQRALKGGQVALMGTARTDRSEKLFQWVYPLLRANTYFISIKNRNKKPKFKKDTTRICVLARSAMLGHLKRKGYRRLIKAPDNSSCARLLEGKKVDAIFGGWHTTLHEFQALKLPIKNLQKSKSILSVDVWLAMSTDVPSYKIKTLQKKMRDMTKDGTYKDFLARYQMQDLPRPKS